MASGNEGAGAAMPAANVPAANVPAPQFPMVQAAVTPASVANEMSAGSCSKLRRRRRSNSALKVYLSGYGAVAIWSTSITLSRLNSGMDVYLGPTLTCLIGGFLGILFWSMFPVKHAKSFRHLTADEMRAHNARAGQSAPKSAAQAQLTEVITSASAPTPATAPATGTPASAAAAAAPASADAVMSTANLMSRVSSTTALMDMGESSDSEHAPVAQLDPHSGVVIMAAAPAGQHAGPATVTLSIFQCWKTYCQISRYIWTTSILFIYMQIGYLVAFGLADDSKQVLELISINYVWPILSVLLTMKLPPKPRTPEVKRRLRLTTVVLAFCCCFTFLSVMLVVTDFKLSSFSGSVMPYVLCASQAVAWSLYTQYQSALTPEAVAQGFTSADLQPLSTRFVPPLLVLSGVALFVLWAFLGGVPSFSATRVVLLLCQSAGPQLTGYAAWNIATSDPKSTPGRRVIASSNLLPVTATVVAMICLNEMKSPFFVLPALMLAVSAMMCLVCVEYMSDTSPLSFVAFALHYFGCGGGKKADEAGHVLVPTNPQAGPNKATEMHPVATA